MTHVISDALVIDHNARQDSPTVTKDIFEEKKVGLIIFCSTAIREKLKIYDLNLKHKE